MHFDGDLVLDLGWVLVARNSPARTTGPRLVAYRPGPREWVIGSRKWEVLFTLNGWPALVWRSHPRSHGVSE